MRFSLSLQVLIFFFLLALFRLLLLPLVFPFAQMARWVSVCSRAATMVGRPCFCVCYLFNFVGYKQLMSDEHAYLNKMNITADKKMTMITTTNTTNRNERREQFSIPQFHSVLLLDCTISMLQSKPLHEPLTIYYPFKRSINLMSKHSKTCSPFNGSEWKTILKISLAVNVQHCVCVYSMCSWMWKYKCDQLQAFNGS